METVISQQLKRSTTEEKSPVKCSDTTNDCAKHGPGFVPAAIGKCEYTMKGIQYVYAFCACNTTDVEHACGCGPDGKLMKSEVLVTNAFFLSRYHCMILILPSPTVCFVHGGS